MHACIDMCILSSSPLSVQQRALAETLLSAPLPLLCSQLHSHTASQLTAALAVKAASLSPSVSSTATKMDDSTKRHNITGTKEDGIVKGRGLCKLLLEGMAAGLVRTPLDIQCYLQSTLLYRQV